MAEVIMTFNGESRPYVQVLHGLERSAFAPITRELLEVSGVAGAYLTGTRTGVREITVPIKIKGEDYSDLQALKEDISEWLIHDKPKELTFSDEPNRTYYAVIEGDLNTEDIIDHGKGEVKFLCPDPYKYGEEINADITEGRIVTNTGSADTKPTFDLEVKKNVTFAMVQTGVEDYMMIGAPANVDQSSVNTRTLLINEDGSNIAAWQPVPTEIGTHSGSLHYDGSGINVTNYGTGTKYHGPHVYREVPLTTDFEVEVRGQLYSSIAEIGKVGMILADDRLRTIGMFSAMDTVKTVHSKKAEARVGPYIGDYKNYVISDRNYLHRWQDFPFYLRFKRVGQTFEFYVARVLSDGKHVNTMTKSWSTVNTDYLAPLKYVTIYFQTIGAPETPYINRIDTVKAWSLGKATVDQTPYIAYPGDVITFNHDERNILINGIDRTELKDFGARYFSLSKGENVISVYPQEAFNANIRYKERFK